MTSPKIRKIVPAVLCLMLAGCAFVKPTRHLDEVTPIDWGLSDSFEHAVTIVPFDAQNDTWGLYAAKQMTQYLIENKAFKQVIFSETEPAETPYVLKGDIEHLFYGGTHSPSQVCVSVRIVDTRDGQTRFMRISKMSSEKTAVHATWLSRVYVPSPYPEEIMNALLRHIAGDIAERTALPAKERP